MSAHPASRLVAVTGASGLMGRSIVPALLAAGWRVRVLSRHTAAMHPAAETMPGTLEDPEALRMLTAGASAVVHLAGMAHTHLRTPQQYAHARDVNVHGTERLLVAARHAGVGHFVLMSSAHVYRYQAGLALNEQAEIEPGAADNRTGYAGLKVEAERAAQAAASTAMRATILRPCLTYGPRVRFNLQSLMRAIRGGYYVHPGGADVDRSFASVDTVAAAVLHLLHQPAQASAICNVADRQAVSLRQWTNALADALGSHRPRSVPVTLLRAAAAAGSAVASLGLPAPLTLRSLAKLTAPFTLDTKALADTGFTWPGNEGRVVQSMADCFLAEERERRP